MATIISDPSQAKDLKFGDPFIIEPEGFNDPGHDVEAFAEAHSKLSEQVQDILSTVDPPPDVRETISVEFTETHAVLTSSIDQTVELGGDVRDGAAKLSAGKASKRSLTDEGHGFISINGQEFTS